MVIKTLLSVNKYYAMTFAETDARIMGRTATGVRGMKLREEGDYVGAAVLNPESNVLVVTERGYGKQPQLASMLLRTGKR